MTDKPTHTLYGMPIIESDLIPEGQIWVMQPCFRPKLHSLPHGMPLDEREEEDAMLYGRCGVPRRTYGIMNVGKTR